MTRRAILLLLLVLSGYTTSAQSSINLSHTQAVLSFCPRPWIGLSGLDPSDSDATHTLELTLKPAWVRFTLNYGGTSNDWTRNDGLFSLNASAKIIAAINNTNDLTVYSNAVKAIFARYTNSIWGWLAYGEPNFTADSATNYATYVKVARYLIDSGGYKGIIRLCGPSTANDFLDGFLNFLPMVALTNLEVIDAHDYFACPGNGVCTNGMCTVDGLCSGTYAHPSDSPSGGIPNLAGRIANMRSWAVTAGATNLLIIDEYGLYSGDTGDARLTATTIGTNQPCIAILSTPNGPVGNCPWNHATPAVGWDVTLLQLLNTSCFLP